MCLQLHCNIVGCRTYIGVDSLPSILKPLGDVLMATGKPDGIVLQHKADVSTIAEIVRLVSAGEFESK